jgi:predicted DNA-binding ribbon-helix-helix protein
MLIERLCNRTCLGDSPARYRGAAMKRGAVMKSSIVKHSVFLASHKTSVSLEDDFWNALKKIAGDRHVRLSELIGSIKAQQQHGNLSSALRLFVLEYYRSKAAEKPGDERAMAARG